MQAPAQQSSSGAEDATRAEVASLWRQVSRLEVGIAVLFCVCVHDQEHPVQPGVLHPHRACSGGGSARRAGIHTTSLHDSHQHALLAVCGMQRGGNTSC